MTTNLTNIPNSEIQELKKALKFVSKCSVESCAVLINEILAFEPLYVLDSTAKQLLEVEEVSVNGKTIQLSVEEYEVISS